MNTPFRHRRMHGLRLLFLRTIIMSGCLISAVAFAATPADIPSVQIHAGRIIGKRAQVNGVPLREFLGIPYAAPPTGPLRWKPPQPVTHWHTPRTTQQFGPSCMQRPIYGDMVFRSDGMSEDCLYLNVWTPAHKATAKLPVLVYFHGGGLMAGSGSEPRYDGASLAARGIVTVTINYRLGVFGFLALPALAAESPHHAAGDYGLLDQVAALRWVRNNISRFGGDPSRITIGGESSGSISVSQLMASPLSRGLIAGAIGESGAMFPSIKLLTLDEAESRGRAFMKQVGADSLSALRAMPAKALLKATAQEQSMYFRPDIDGYFLDQSLSAIYTQGRQAHVPLLLGSNSQEGFYTTILDGKTPTPAHYRAALKRIFGDQAKRALALYPGHTKAQVKQSGTALSGDLFIAHATWRWMELQRRTGKAPVYFYYFAQARPPKRHPQPGDKPAPGAVHSGEIEYALGNLDSNHVYAWTPTDHKVSRIMEGYFAHFIKTGDPNAPGLPYWPAVRKVDGGLLRQVIDACTHTRIDQGAARQAFLRAFLADRRDE